MGNLFDLIAATARKAPAKPDTGPRRVELLAPAAANDPQAAAEPHHAPAAPAPLPTPAPAAEAASEPRRNAWTVTRNGAPICRMVGQPMTRPEALAAARWRWPDADILET